MSPDQPDTVHRKLFHNQQSVVTQRDLAVRRAQALPPVLRAAVMSECVPRVVTQLLTLLEELCPQTDVSTLRRSTSHTGCIMTDPTIIMTPFVVS